MSPTKADNLVTWDGAVMVAALVEGLEIDFPRMLLTEIHKSAFKTSTTYPFSCIIFHLCRDVGVSIWNYNKLVQASRTLYISLIQDLANVEAVWRGS